MGPRRLPALRGQAQAEVLPFQASAAAVLLVTMPDTQELLQHVKPFVYANAEFKALHFSISEIQSRMRLQDPVALDLKYTRTMMGFLVFQPAPLHIVMIGLGGGSLAKFCHHHLPGARLQVVEINPHVIALREDFQVPPDSERFKVLKGDGAQFVRERASPCDVLLVDGFGSQGMPGRLGSQGFYDHCHEMLDPGGILVVNLHRGHIHHPLYLERIRRSFDDRVLVCNDAEQTNSIVFACKGPGLDVDPGEARAQLNRLDPDILKPLEAAFGQVLTALQVARPNAPPAAGG